LQLPWKTSGLGHPGVGLNDRGRSKVLAEYNKASEVDVCRGDRVDASAKLVPTSSTSVTLVGSRAVGDVECF